MTTIPDPLYRRSGPRSTGQPASIAGDLAAVARIIRDAPADYPGLPGLRVRRDELAQLLADDFGPGCPNPDCPCHVPSLVPCSEFQGFDGDRWCPRCGWAERLHEGEQA